MTSTSGASVQLRGVTRHHGSKVALNRVNLNVAPGHFVVLLGPSGSGKTTLLSIVGGFVEPDEGQVTIDGVDMAHVPPARRPTTTVFQDYALFPHMTVGANIGFGLEMRGIGRELRGAKIEEALELVDLAGFAKRGTHQLSGGQKQRVALARALVVQPRVLLLDEPLGALDLNLRRQMQTELVRLHKTLGMTFIHVTHDQDEAMSMADTIVVMRDGRIEDQGTPERIYRQPATSFVATFMGESNLVPATVLESSGGQLKLDTCFGPLLAHGHAMPGAKVILSMRPEYLRAGNGQDISNRLGRRRVESITFIGSHRRCLIQPAPDLDSALLVQLPSDLSVEPGAEIDLHIRPEDVAVIKEGSLYTSPPGTADVSSSDGDLHH